MTARRASAESFTQAVIAELAPHVPPLRCCRAAMLGGMLAVSEDPHTITTTRLIAARIAVQVLHADGHAAHVVRIASARRPRYSLWGADVSSPPPADAELHCVRAWLRGAVLMTGRVARPESSPHLEITCPDARAAAAVSSALSVIDVPSRTRVHRGRVLVSVRSAATVGALLSTIGAQTARLQFESGRVVRDLRGGVNRRLNAETANLWRVAGAAVTQLAAAELVCADLGRWRALSPAVREAASLRRDHPEADLGRLALLAGCSRQAMAGRLHRLRAAARAF